MKRFLAGLTTQERRWLVGIGVVLFLIINYFFVWSHFHDWARNTMLMQRTEKTNEVYSTELRHQAEYQRKINELQSDGSSVLPEDQAIDFVHFYNSRAISNKIIVVNQGALVTHTNEFFLEQQMGITIQADETNLVKFLYSLAAGNSMMRVRAMSLHPDPSHRELSANVTLVASYQKKKPVRGATPTAPHTVAVAPKPAPAPIAQKPPTPPVEPPTANVPPREHSNHMSNPFSRLLGTNKTASLKSNRP
ncbi:MAG TPA: hypothetical protein VH413_03275 [Verrucomicrobiae bacterium]|jgi:hypothetical protein|nr:hypothetical protein [Verrucomicrobiae bacterium]